MPADTDGAAGPTAGATGARPSLRPPLSPTLPAATGPGFVVGPSGMNQMGARSGVILFADVRTVVVAA